ncbi:MAG: restriction endonuclease subunit S [Nitrospirae bacterium]|nr:restriction endonuclease subunit S [Nitrospirota bacterium]
MNRQGCEIQGQNQGGEDPAPTHGMNEKRRHKKVVLDDPVGAIHELPLHKPHDKKDLPEGWEWKTVGEVCRTKSGGTPSRKKESYFTGSIPWVKSGELPDGFVAKIEEFITEDAISNSSAKLLPAGTLLVALYGATVGKLGILRNVTTTNQAVCAIFPPEHIDTKYLFWYLRNVRSDLVAQAIGGAQPNISQGILRTLPIPVAPLNQQKLIVSEIEKQFSRLDEAVDGLKRIKANLKRYKASVLKAAVEGKLTEEWRKKNICRGGVPPPCPCPPNNTGTGRGDLAPTKDETGAELLKRILAVRKKKWEEKNPGMKYKEPVAPDTANLPELPEGWVWATVEAICEQVVDCPHSTPHFQEEGHPCIDTNWMTPDGLSIEKARFVSQEVYQARIARLIPQRDDIIFAREGTIGTAIIIPDRMMPCLGQRVMLLRASSQFNGKLLMHALQSEVVRSQYRTQALGSTVPHINVGDVKRFTIPVPPMREQLTITAEVDRRLSLVREVETQVDANLTRAERLRQSILKKAFLGGLVS